MRHLGEERILDRLENILHLAEDFEGADGLTEPMPVKPGQHYAMGGIETNEFGETVIGGLYAAGECACASVHGANRLGGNALPELIVFGKRAGRHAAGEEMGEAEVTTGKDGEWEPADYEFEVEVGETGGQDPAAADGGAVATDPDGVLEAEVESAKDRVEELLSRKGRNHAETRSKVQQTMTANVNVFREEGRLEETLSDLHEARETYKDVAVSGPVPDVQHRPHPHDGDPEHPRHCRGADDGRARATEFRGAHWRKERQERDDENWLKHTPSRGTTASRSCGTSRRSSKERTRRTNRRPARTEPRFRHDQSGSFTVSYPRRSKADNGTASVTTTTPPTSIAF